MVLESIRSDHHGDVKKVVLPEPTKRSRDFPFRLPEDGLAGIQTYLNESHTGVDELFIEKVARVKILFDQQKKPFVYSQEKVLDDKTWLYEALKQKYNYLASILASFRIVIPESVALYRKDQTIFHNEKDKLCVIPDEKATDYFKHAADLRIIYPENSAKDLGMTDQRWESGVKQIEKEIRGKWPHFMEASEILSRMRIVDPERFKTIPHTQDVRQALAKFLSHLSKRPGDRLGWSIFLNAAYRLAIIAHRKLR